MSTLPHPGAPTPLHERFDLRALYDTSRLVSGTLDVEFLLGNLVLTAMSKLLTTRGAAFLYVDEADGREAIGDGPQTARRARVAAVRGVSGLAIGEVVDLAMGDGAAQGADVPDVLARLRLVLALPIRVGTRDVGLVAFGARIGGSEYDADALRFLRSLVGMTAPAVENARTVAALREANRHLDGRIRQLETLYELARAFAGTADRRQIGRLLGFTLMGQTTALRHAFHVVPPGRDAGAEGAFSPISVHGFRPNLVGGPLLDEACGREAPFVPAPGTLLAEAGVALAVPLSHEATRCGLLVLGPKGGGGAYSVDEIALVEAIARLALAAVRNSYLLDDQVEKRRMEAEMRLARSIQQRLLPQRLPTIAGVDLAAETVPARTVGGDLFDAVLLPDGRLFLAIADVTGKGVPASLLMANLQACLHILFPDPGPLADVAARVNRVICENTAASTFITAVFALYDPATGVLDYVNAGHNVPFVVRADGTVEELREGGLLLGVMASATYEAGRVTLDVGDVATFYTDGVTEAQAPDREELEEERLVDVLVAHREAPAAAQLAGIQSAVDAFTGPIEEAFDDVTIVVLRRTAA